MVVTQYFESGTVARMPTKDTRQIFLSDDLAARLEARKKRSHVPVNAQILQALELWLETEPDIWTHRPLIGKPDRRKLMVVPNEIWDRLRERKSKTGFDLDEQVQIACALYLETAAAENKPIIPHVTPSLTTEIPAEMEAVLSRMVDERIDERLAHLPPKTGTLQYLHPEVIENENDSGLVEIKMLAKPPCGPWKLALEEAETYRMSADMAKMLNVKKGDFLVTADGQSMEDAGIPDGALVLMRPLRGRKPENNRPTLVQVVTEDDEYFGTIKRWYESPAGNPDLRDGRNMPYELPANVRRVEAVAVEVGIIARRD